MNKVIAALVASLFAAGAFAQAAAPAVPATPAPAVSQATIAAPAHKMVKSKGQQHHKKVAKKKAHKPAKQMS